ncbi:ABC transporter permease [Actinomycetes bacterium]|nr:ABC transporter permease [Actinomycetes bacterium]
MSVATARRRLALTRFANSFRHDQSGMTGVVILAIFIATAILAPILIPDAALDVTKADGGRFEGPSLSYPLGTDESGRSVLLLLAWGTRISLTVGIAATIISMVLGTAFGIAAGHFRGVGSHALVGVTDWFLVIPFLPLAIVLATVLGPSTTNLIIVIGITSWAGTARLIRAQTLSIEGRPYLERSKALGAGNWYQMSRHVLPNVFPLVLANTTLTVAIVILSETTLSFLGLGDPQAPSWGALLDRAFSSGAVSRGAWWYVLPPGICVVLVVLAFTLVGRAMERIVDPRRAS